MSSSIEAVATQERTNVLAVGRFALSKEMQGIVWKLLSCAAFAIGNTLVRFLTKGAGDNSNPLPPDTITFFQNLFGFLVMAPWALRLGLSSMKTRWVGRHAVRIVSGVAGIITLYTAFTFMPMAQAVALQFTGPIFSVIGARLYLSERIGLTRTAGIIIGLGGAFFLTRPDKAFVGAEAALGWACLFPIASAVCFAIAKLVGRDLGAKGEPADRLALYLLFFMIPVSLVSAAFKWTTPTAPQIFYLAALGAISSFAHFAMAKSYCLAEVTFLTPFGFARILLTMLLGYLFFNELPKEPTLWIGFALVMASAWLVVKADRKKPQA